MPLRDTVRVLFQIPNGWDKEELEAVLVRPDDDVNFEEDVETINDIDYLAFWTNHFSPYALIDKLSAAEKQSLAEQIAAKERSAIKTGEAIGLYAVLDAILLAAAGALVLILTKKRKSI